MAAVVNDGGHSVTLVQCDLISALHAEESSFPKVYMYATGSGRF
jgi:hypothetical protein